MKHFSFWTSGDGKFPAFRHMVKRFPYQLNVVLSDLNDPTVPDSVIKHAWYPDNLPISWKAHWVKHRECLDFCETRYMVWIDADIIVHGNLEFLNMVRDKNFLLAAFREPHTWHRILHTGFFVVNLNHVDFHEYRALWEEWDVKAYRGDDQKYLGEFFNQFPYIIFPHQYLCFPNEETEVSKETLVHYTGARRWLLPYLEYGGRKGKKPACYDALEKDMRKFYETMGWED